MVLGNPKMDERRNSVPMLFLIFSPTMGDPSTFLLGVLSRLPISLRSAPEGMERHLGFEPPVWLGKLDVSAFIVLSLRRC